MEDVFLVSRTGRMEELRNLFFYYGRKFLYILFMKIDDRFRLVVMLISYRF